MRPADGAAWITGASGGIGRAVALRLGKGQTINDVQVVFSSYSVLNIDNNKIVNISSV